MAWEFEEARSHEVLKSARGLSISSHYLYHRLLNFLLVSNRSHCQLLGFEERIVLKIISLRSSRVKLLTVRRNCVDSKSYQLWIRVVCESLIQTFSFLRKAGIEREALLLPRLTVGCRCKVDLAVREGTSASFHVFARSIIIYSSVQWHKIFREHSTSG